MISTYVVDDMLYYSDTYTPEISPFLFPGWHFFLLYLFLPRPVFSSIYLTPHLPFPSHIY